MNNIVKAVGGLVAVGAVGVLGFVGYVASQPGEITLSRSIEVAASPDDVAPYATDMKLWNEWSPWADIDPNVKQTFSDPPSGKGAWYTWEGNDEVGKGKMTLAVADPGKAVHELAFEKPFEATATATIEWEGTPEKTKVTWSFHQDADFGTKAANVFMDIQGMLAKDYDKGLAQLQPLVEKAATDRMAAEKKAAEEAAKAEEEAKLAEGSEGEGAEGSDAAPPG